MNDAEPIVLDPDDPAFAAPPDLHTRPGGALTALVGRGEAALPTSTAAQAYLRSVGISDPAVWSAFRVGAGEPSLADGWDEAACTEFRRLGLLPDRHPLVVVGTGVMIPTVDPRDPSRVVGLIRQNAAQNKHRFVTPPAGIACAADIADAAQVVLVDTPLLGLGLAQMGVRGVAIVEDQAVLAPLLPWLSARRLVVAGCFPARIAALRAALGDLAASAQVVCVPGNLARTQATQLAALGLEPTAAEAVAKPGVAALPRLLRDLAEFARGRLPSPAGTVALVAAGADIPDLLSAYRVGFFPEDMRSVLIRDARRALGGRRLANGLVLPAYDEAGAVVDLLVVRHPTDRRQHHGVAEAPQGLLGPAIITAYDAIVVVDTLGRLVERYREGQRNVLLLRGVADAQRNAARMAGAGVQRVELHVGRDAAEMAAVFTQAGMEATIGPRVLQGAGVMELPARPVGSAKGEAGSGPASPSAAVPLAPSPSPQAPPAPAASAPTVAAPAAIPLPDPMVFVEEDRTAEVAIFAVGPVRYAIELNDDRATVRSLVARAHGLACHDRFDLANAAQCQRFAGNAARRIRLPVATVMAHLSALLTAIRARQEAEDALPVAVLADADRADAIGLLEAPDLLRRISADLTTLGWAGEDRAKSILYLAALSRLLPEPLWVAYQASVGAAPWHAVGALAALLPAEEALAFHRLSEARIAQADRRALRHRLLLVDRAEAIRPEAALALRILHERGGIGWATAGVAASGSAAPLLGDACGPVAVIAAAAGALDHRCRSCFLVVPVDESAAQTARIQAEHRRALEEGAATTAKRAAIIARHHALQRLLQRLPVRIPFAGRIAFPAGSPRYREEHAHFLRLIQASALLHQRQRPQADGVSVATEADFSIAAGLVDGLLGVDGAGLGRPARDLLAGMERQGPGQSYTMSDLPAFLPDASRWTLRAALQDLLDFGRIESPTTGRGRVRTYTLATATATSPTTGIRLLPADAVPASYDLRCAEVGGLAAVGGDHSANLTPSRAVG